MGGQREGESRLPSEEQEQAATETVNWREKRQQKGSIESRPNQQWWRLSFLGKFWARNETEGKKWRDGDEMRWDGERRGERYTADWDGGDGHGRRNSKYQLEYYQVFNWVANGYYRWELILSSCSSSLLFLLCSALLYFDAFLVFNFFFLLVRYRLFMTYKHQSFKVTSYEGIKIQAWTAWTAWTDTDPCQMHGG